MQKIDIAIIHKYINRLTSKNISSGLNLFTTVDVTLYNIYMHKQL